MKGRGWTKWVILAGCLAVGVVVLTFLLRQSSLGEAATWQRQVSPGRLSAGHAFLENNCSACHTAITGADATKCIACHANNEWLLGRQPTAFHASIGSCRECHAEHQGANVRTTEMDHAALTRIGLRQLKGQAQVTGGENLHSDLVAWLTQSRAVGYDQHEHPGTTPEEAVLDCANCHATKDRHFKLFGQDCAQCHSTTKWTIPEFRHPSASSTDCAQCHQAPPSHYMGHFHMVSMKVARKPHAQVNQCYLCHQTTAWNDIKGLGFYKHH